MRWDYPPLDINPVFSGLGETRKLLLLLLLILLLLSLLLLLLLLLLLFIHNNFIIVIIIIISFVFNRLCKCMYYVLYQLIFFFMPYVKDQQLYSLYLIMTYSTFATTIFKLIVFIFYDFLFYLRITEKIHEKCGKIGSP